MMTLDSGLLFWATVYTAEAKPLCHSCGDNEKQIK